MVRDPSQSQSEGGSVGISGSVSEGVTGVNVGAEFCRNEEKSQETVLTSITGAKVNVKVEGNTDLKGAMISGGEYDAEGNFIANEELKVETGSLTYEDLSNKEELENIGVNVDTNVQVAQSDTDTTRSDESGTKLNTSNLGFNNEERISKTKILATLGEGSVLVGAEEIQEGINRDTENIEQEIYDVVTNKVDIEMTLDHRLLTENGNNEIKEDAKKAGETMQSIDAIVPSATNENKVLANIGTGLNYLNTLTLGVTPSDDSSGGIIAQIPVLFGQHDINQQVIQVKSENLLTEENRANFIPITQSEYYKQASEETQARLKLGNLYVSKEAVSIDETTASYQNFTNGMMNNEADAIKNGISQTHLAGDENINVTLNYNPTHGLLSDGLESAVDKLGGTTGMAEQTGEFIQEVTTARGNKGSNFAAHSQGNLLTNSGVNYIKEKGSFENGGFKDREYFMNPDGLTKEEKEFGLPTFAGYGSPVNTTTMDKTLTSEIDGKESPFKFIGNYTNENDFVGEVLGGNEGKNEDRGWERVTDIINPMQYVNGGNLFVNDNVGLRPSPHSNYECNSVAGARCGDRP